MSNEEVKALFEKHEKEYGELELIPESERLNPCHDLCAMLYLQRKFGFNYEIVSGAAHDIMYFNGKIGQLSEEDVIYLNRCAVMVQDGHLCMFT